MFLSDMAGRLQFFSFFLSTWQRNLEQKTLLFILISMFYRLTSPCLSPKDTECAHGTSALYLRSLLETDDEGLSC
jgi:hypothetical protein